MENCIIRCFRAIEIVLPNNLETFHMGSCEMIGLPVVHTFAQHGIKYTRIPVFSDSAYIRENTGQKNPVFKNTLRSVSRSN